MFRFTALRLPWRRLARDDRGAVVIVAAVLLPVIMGFGALGIDASHLYVSRNLLQTTADAAARAAVGELGNQQTDAVETARYYAGRTMPLERYGDVLPAENVQLGVWNATNRTFLPTNGANGANAIRVVTRRDVPLTFARIWGDPTSGVTAQAIAALVTEPSEACVLALGESDYAYRSLDFRGNVTGTSQHCSFATNSTSAESINVSGSSTSLTAYSLYSMGGGDIAPFNLAKPASIYRAQPHLDPYEGFADQLSDIKADLPSRSVPSAGGNDTLIFEPGIYSEHVNITGPEHRDAIFRPGVYVFEQSLSMSGRKIFSEDTNGNPGSVSLISQGDITMTGNATLELTAMSEGPTSGLALVSLKQGGDGIDLRGNADPAIDGAVYAPYSNIDFAGTSGATGCLMLIGQRVRLHGTSEFEIDGCDQAGTPQIQRFTTALVM